VNPVPPFAHGLAFFSPDIVLSFEYKKICEAIVLKMMARAVTPDNPAPMKRVQNLKYFWRSSQNYFVLALFCSLHSSH
jgi:hypothetical protein